MDPSSRARPRLLAVAALGLALGAALRVACATGELWFDELWSLEKAQRLGRALDVLLAPEFQHDNNHWLNTLWLHWIGADVPPLVQRLPACLASVLSILVMGWIGWRRDPSCGVLAMLLAAGSFLLVQYGTEARGYAGAVLFGLAGYALLSMEAGRAGWRVPAFWGVALLGTASHLTFLYGYLALLVWQPLHLLRRERPRTAALRLALYHALPLAVIGLLYVTTLRHMVIGGGPQHTTGKIVVGVLGQVFGFPVGSPWALAAVVVAALVVVTEVVLRARERDDSALFFPWVVALAPALFLLVRGRDVLYMRYFLVCVPFFLLLLASLLARGLRAARPVRAAAVLVLVGTLAGNALPLARLVRLGRGQYGEAVLFLARESPPGPIEIGAQGDHDLRLLRHHAARIAPEREFVYFPSDVPAPHPPRWILVDSLDPRFEPEAELPGAFGRHYVLAHEFRHGGLSGLSWFLYRRAKAPSADDEAPGR